ncbi:MAG: N-acetylmuramoyl-L-alanine amidase [Goleter apudmare HA4340-LM2]|jgi:N-acetylmuramoyl-L-alanine amidase/uncharacterized caspase-like protein|nr:N-acetylmuramoyl-L-alanine amidase [Goleter apudmare HA4340-LM2]
MAKVALLIGISEYEPGLNPLPAAVKDVEAIARVLNDPEMGAFDQVKPLTNPDPQLMQYEIETLFSECNKDDLVLLFFSGHGIRDNSGKLYFATSITRNNLKGELIRSTTVPASFVHEVMKNSRARRQVVILDCCFSGAFDPALQAKDDSFIDLQSQLGAEGRVVLASSSSTQYSFEQTGYHLSLYTRYLVEGIETGAGDQNEDGKISIRELHEYAASKVQETAPNMTPKLITIKDMGFDIVLAKAKITDPRLKYRRQVEKYSSRGKISSIGRTILDTLQYQLGISLEVAREIEQEVLRPYKKRLENLQRYQQAFASAIVYEYPLSSEAQSELNDLQTILGLRKEDTEPIEQEVINQRPDNVSLSQFSSPKSAAEQHHGQSIASVDGANVPTKSIRNRLFATNNKTIQKFFIGSTVLGIIVVGGGTLLSNWQWINTSSKPIPIPVNTKPVNSTPTSLPICNIASVNTSSPPLPRKGVLVMIDPGHGIPPDTGNRGIILEDDIVIPISKNIATVLEKNGVQALLTRNTECVLTENVSSSLEYRKQITKLVNANLFVSVHANAFNSKSSGLEIFSTSNSNSQRLAKLVSSTLFKSVIGLSNRGLKDGDRFAIFRGVTIPAILIETGFVDNKNDAALLRNPDFQKKLAEAIAQGILQYLKEQKQIS